MDFLLKVELNFSLTRPPERTVSMDDLKTPPACPEFLNSLNIL